MVLLLARKNTMITNRELAEDTSAKWIIPLWRKAVRRMEKRIQEIRSSSGRSRSSKKVSNLSYIP